MLRQLTDRNAVLLAIREFDLGRRAFLKKYGYRSATDFLVEHDGRFYDSKAITGAAFGYQHEDHGPLRPNQFGGGEASVKKKLEKLGFTISTVSDYERRDHYLIKLNQHDVPVGTQKADWESPEYVIEPVRLMRDGAKLQPTPPPMTPWSYAYIWINRPHEGGIIAVATIDDVSRAGARCRLRDFEFVDGFGLDELAGSLSKELTDFRKDVTHNRRSKVRYLSRPIWEVLQSRLNGYRKENVLGEHLTRTGNFALALNQLAPGYRIGNLQEIRRQIHGIRNSTKTIFSSKSTKATYAFHSGGREELQFNIGEEGKRFRWGVSFSFEPSRDFPNPDVLAPKVRYFNDYIQAYPGAFSDMSMWRYEGKKGPIEIGAPQPINPTWIGKNSFVFLGKHHSEEIEYDWVLEDFDRLLPLYEYVESGATIVSEKDLPRKFVFKPGHRKKAKTAKVSIVARELEADLRHEAIQRVLHAQLVKQFGRNNVGTEQLCVSGKKIDAVTKRGRGYWIYEIKTSSSPRACLREAIGQLLEYCLWPGGLPATRLIVVGETPTDRDANNYLAALNAKLGIPVEYLSVSVPKLKVKPAQSE